MDRLRHLLFVPALVLALWVAPGQALACKLLPESLLLKLRKTYPEAKLVNLQMLNPRHRSLFSKEHAEGCPGAVRLDFYGDGSEAFALLLVETKSPETILLVAKRVKADDWEISLLQRGDARPVPVIWKEPAAEYDDLWRDKKLRSKGDVVVIAGYDSWARVYGWDGTKIERVQVSD